MVLPSLAAQARQRATPPPVPPIVPKSEFESDEHYKDYMATRRNALERVREFKRPPRVRHQASHAPQIAAAIRKLRLRERHILFGANPETGRKKSPFVSSVQDDRGTAREQHEEDAARIPVLKSAIALHAALVKQEEHASVSLSQVRRAVTAANKQVLQHSADPDLESFHIESFYEEQTRWKRRSISKGLSATRPSAYPALLKLKREREREGRRPQIEARALQLAQKAAKRDADVRVAEWAYNLCYKEEKWARALGTDDLWYLRERRLDAGSALRIARGSKERPRWELSAPRGPVYRRLAATGPRQRRKTRPSGGAANPCAAPAPVPDSDDERVAELIHDYGWPRAAATASTCDPPPPPEELSEPLPLPPDPPQSPQRSRSSDPALARKRMSVGEARARLLNRSFQNLRARLPLTIDDERIASALRETDGHAGLALERLGLSL